VSFSLLNLIIGAMVYMHEFIYGGYILTLKFILTTYGMILWFRDVIIKASYLGHHTKEIKLCPCPTRFLRSMAANIDFFPWLDLIGLLLK